MAGWDSGGSHREDGKWLDTGYILEEEPAGFADGLVVGQDGKKKPQG